MSSKCRAQAKMTIDSDRLEPEARIRFGFLLRCIVPIVLIWYNAIQNLLAHISSILIMGIVIWFRYDR